MKENLKHIIETWRSWKTTARFHNILLFLIFVAVASVLWLIFALNDSMNRGVDVWLRISDVPDSVTFINDPPQKVHVSVSDKGTSLIRKVVLRNLVVDIDFRQFARDGVLRFSKSDMEGALQEIFGSSTKISSQSVDSLRLNYTYAKGKRIPVVVDLDVTPASGSILDGMPIVKPTAVLAYSVSGNLDTLTRVHTEKIIKRDVSGSLTVNAKILSVPGVKFVPASVKVSLNVEPLVRKQSVATVKAIDVPASMSVLLFPSRINVSYYVPMSKFNDDSPEIEVIADYDSSGAATSGHLPLRLGHHPSWCVNVQLLSDNVEYTLVRR